ncbi:hypothetical protein N657DRAFT_650357 [Parathielavia appendiculata]|uniref:Uncharacterized protein n=1 Tax=Parathielavia appendiculata TaxID=2587402 RepID=A0AAN6TRE8_9PEZI|nr:hypothetical protein N657DRAFT_650357 [Parathielavia appendiculata]
MELTIFVVGLLAGVVSAREFTLYEHSNFGGATHRETRPNDDRCWNMNGAGDRASSVRGGGCTTFYRERDCRGHSWPNYGDAPTVPGALNDHIWSFRNRCQGCPDPFDTCQYTAEDGQCVFGYAACLQKMGCGGRAGEADCIGTATGCAIACG